MTALGGFLDLWAGRWLGAVATTTWQGAVLIALVFLITRVLRRRLTPTVRHLLWVVVLLKFCTAPFLSVRIPVLTPPAPAPGLPAPVSTGPWMEAALPAPSIPAHEAVVARTDIPLPSSSLRAPRHTLPLPRVFFLSWLAGVVILLAGIVVKSLRICRRLASAEALKDGPVTEAVARAAVRMGIRPPRVKTSVHITTPLVCGTLRPAVMIPEHVLRQLTMEEMDSVICHELAHIRRRDILTNWVQVVTQACWFFNPLVWYVNRQIRLEREQACDDWVLQMRRGEPKEYAEVLLKVVELCPKSMSLSLGIVGISEPFVLMARRLGTVMDGGRRLSTRVSLLGGLGLLAIAVLGIPAYALTERPGRIGVRGGMGPGGGLPDAALPVATDATAMLLAQAPVPADGAVGPAATQEKVTVSGQVVDEKGAPVAGAGVHLRTFDTDFPAALVQLLSLLSERTVTDTEGRFVFRGIGMKQKNAALVIAGREGLSFGGEVVESRRQNHEGLRIVLKQPADVTGSVADRSGRPVKGAVVTCMGVSGDKGDGHVFVSDTRNGILTAITDGEGRFGIRGLPRDGRVMLVVEADGYARLQVGGTQSEEPALFPVKAGATDLACTLTREGRITGSVTDPVTGRKVTVASLSCLPMSHEDHERVFGHVAEYDAGGNFVFRRLAPGKYMVFSTELNRDPVPEAAPAPLGNIEVMEGGTAEVNLSLVKPGWVTGRVYDEKTGDPMPDSVYQRVEISGPPALMAVFPRSPGQIPVKNGVYQTVLLPGEYTLSCGTDFTKGYRRGPGSGEKRVVVVAGKTVGEVNFSFLPPAGLRGIVVNEQGKPVGGADGRLLRPHMVTGRTGPDGEFELRCTQTALDGLLLATDEKAGLSALVDVPGHMWDRKFWVVLRKNATITGKVVGSRLQGIPSAEIAVRRRRDESFNDGGSVPWYTDLVPSVVPVRRDSEGNFTVNLPARDNLTYEFFFSGPGYGMEIRKDIVVTPGEHRDLGSITLKEANTFVSGKVVDAQGNPVAGADVSASGDGQHHRVDTSLADGSFRIDGLVEGRVRVWATLLAYNEDKTVRRLVLSGVIRDVPAGSKDLAVVMRPVGR